MKSIIVGGSLGAASGLALASALEFNKVESSESINWKRLIKYTSVGALTGSVSGLAYNKYTITSTAAKISPLKKGVSLSVILEKPTEYISCNDVADKLGITRQKVVSTARKAGVFGNPKYCKELGGYYRPERIGHLSDSFGYSLEAIELIRKSL